MNPKALIVPFTKMNGAGNDFIVIDNRFFHLTDEELSGLALRYCPRRTGIGADGILALNNPEKEYEHFWMRYFNADGSLGTMCGNGARCLARFAGMAGIDANPLIFDTDGGLYTADLLEDDLGSVRLHVPAPKDFGEVVLQDVEVEGPTYGIWTGTEHVVRFVEYTADAPIHTEGREIRADAALAPAGANVNFVEVVDADAGHIRARTFEKGVEGETLACGTGAVASAVASRLAGHVNADDIAVEMLGGTLRVGFSLANGAATAEEIEDLTLEGPAEVVYVGTLEA